MQYERFLVNQLLTRAGLAVYRGVQYETFLVNQLLTRAGLAVYRGVQYERFRVNQVSLYNKGVGDSKFSY